MRSLYRGEENFADLRLCQHSVIQSELSFVGKFSGFDKIAEQQLLTKLPFPRKIHFNAIAPEVKKVTGQIAARRALKPLHRLWGTMGFGTPHMGELRPWATTGDSDERRAGAISDPSVPFL